MPYLEVKRNLRASILPVFPQMYLKKIIKIVQISVNKNCRFDTNPEGPGAGVASYTQGTYMVLMEGLQRGSFVGKLKILVTFLRVTRDQRSTTPPHALFP